MSSQWGQKLKIFLFGESHGDGIGVVMDGVPPGIKLDMSFIRREMERRSPGRHRWSTQRKEADAPVILSGVYNEHTTGILQGSIINQFSFSIKYGISVGPNIFFLSALFLLFFFFMRSFRCT
jgi:chorismate synthase